jgi:hypothetical protein
MYGSLGAICGSDFSQCMALWEQFVGVTSLNVWLFGSNLLAPSSIVCGAAVKSNMAQTRKGQKPPLFKVNISFQYSLVAWKQVSWGPTYCNHDCLN